MVPPTFITEFCPCQNIHFVGVQRKPKTFYKYCFDEKTQKFQPLNCEKCQPIIQESDLFPLYVVHRKEYKQPILFVKNTVTNEIEQYQYDGGFKQVHFPEVEFNPNIYNRSNVLYTVDESGTGRTFIGRHENGYLIKKRYSRYSDSMEEIRDVAESKVTTLFNGTHSFSNSGSRNFMIVYCSTSKQNLVLVPIGYLGYCRYMYDQATGKFKAHYYLNNVTTEKHLYPLYSVNAVGGRPLFFVMDLMTCQVEQYLYNESKNFFFPTTNSEVEYDPKHEIPDCVLSLVNSSTIIMKDCNGNFKVQKLDSKKNIFVTVPVELKSLENVPNNRGQKKLLSTDSIMVHQGLPSSSSSNSNTEAQLDQITNLVKGLRIRLARLKAVVLKKGEDSISEVSSQEGSSSGSEYDFLDDEL